ncbi:MAG: AAA family ATPase [Chromatiaceae bacterium]|nr:AAA family ATPase [Chromatiaceae bacterium]
MLDSRIRNDLETIQQELLGKGGLLPKARLDDCYALFRERFGPDVLASLVGEGLLNLMHLHGNQDSLVYWLEFKNDDEFPAQFGSISGGSALKFGLYRRKETGEWMNGSPKQQKVITVDEAIALARKHRDELVAGTKVLDAFPQQPSEADYRALQKEMDAKAPTVSRLAWGHKYFSLIYPNLLDDYHSPAYARFHLIKLLQRPLSSAEQRYLDAYLFLQIANNLGWPVNHLTKVLNARNGQPHEVWLFKVASADASRWSEMQTQGFIASGPAQLPALDWLDGSSTTLGRLKQTLTELDTLSASEAIPSTARALRDFACVMEEPDLVLAVDGQVVKGIGKVTGDGYQHDESASSDAPHRRTVQWRALSDWKTSAPAAPVVGVKRLGDTHVDLLIAIEQHLLDAQGTAKPATPSSSSALAGLAGEIQLTLERKGQVILYGPPGTGKTWQALRVAQELAALHGFGKGWDSLSDEEQKRVFGADAHPALVRLCTFHPAYGYEDFIEGYRPTTGRTDQLGFELRPGLFKRCCEEATANPRLRFYLIIDEINRGDIPRIFGELLTLLEKDKRGRAVELPLSGQPFSVPPNLSVIGTMNTADRSIALLDTALRRRFGFRELMPEVDLLKGAVLAGSIPLDGWLAALNQRILEHVGRDARNLQIGHAYFLQSTKDGAKPVTDLARFRRILAEDILPLLEEYCYEDYETLAKLIGKDFVDLETRRLNRGLFQATNKDAFVQAILAPTPELTTTKEATTASGEDGSDTETNDATEADAGAPAS